MIWLGLAIGAVAVVLMLGAALHRHRMSPGAHDLEAVDPLLITGIAITGGGVVLAATLGALMYGMVIVGLIVVVIGVNRTRHMRH